MSWAKIDDGFSDHPKVVGCSLQAVGLWTLCLSWASGRKTGGAIPLALPRRFGDRAGRATQELLRCGLWERSGDNIIIHDFGKYGPPADLSAKRAEAGRAGGLAKQTASKPEAIAKQTPSSGNPVPDPEPQAVLSAPTGAALSLPAGEQLTPQDHEERASGTQVAAVFEAWKQAGHLNGRAKLTEDRRRKIRARLREFPLEDVMDAATGIWESTWHVEQGQTDLSLALRDGAHLERFRDMRRGIVARASPGPRGRADRQVAESIAAGKVDMAALSRFYPREGST